MHAEYLPITWPPGSIYISRRWSQSTEDQPQAPCDLNLAWQHCGLQRSRENRCSRSWNTRQTRRTHSAVLKHSSQVVGWGGGKKQSNARHSERLPFTSSRAGSGCTRRPTQHRPRRRPGSQQRTRPSCRGAPSTGKGQTYQSHSGRIIQRRQHCIPGTHRSAYPRVKHTCTASSPCIEPWP